MKHWGKEQQEVVDEEQSCLVKACPGSGKTRAIIAKLLKVCEETRNTPRKVACITYTNAAVHEISRRVQRVGGLPPGVCEINTIHTFCLLNVLRPFGHLLGDEVPPHFGILGPDSHELIEIGGEVFGGRINQRRVRDMLTNIKRRDDGIFCPPGLDEELAQEFYTLVSERGMLTFGDIVYLSEKLVARYPFIRRSLASKFYRIIVDEFQDTSPEQASILQAIAGVDRTRLMLVGDENQSIFGFSDARPDIFTDFADFEGATILEKTLTGNFRCSAKIVDVAEKICSRRPRMVAVGPDRDCQHDVEIFDCGGVAAGIIDHFIAALEEHDIPLGNSAILAAQWPELRTLGRALSIRGVPVVGPGARPYRRTSEFTNIAEAAAECAVTLTVEAQIRLERAVSFSLRTLNKGNLVREDRWNKRKAVCKIRREAARLHGDDMEALEWIRSMGQATADILASLSLIAEEAKPQIIASATAMRQQISESHVGEDVSAFGLNELSIFSNPHDSVELCTMHSAKGLEWDAVALIDLHEGSLPHTYTKDFDEARRLFYVGCTRAKKLLMLFTHSSREPSRYLELLD